MSDAALIKLNSQVFVMEPDKSSNAGNLEVNPESPSVILVFGWMDARLAHVKKYAEAFKQRHPSSTIVIILVNANFYWSTENSKEYMLSPVLDIVKREEQSGDLARGILVHVMSNGGGFQLMTLRKMLQQKPLLLPDKPRAPVALILDSTPGDNGLESAISGNTAPTGISRFIAIPFITLLYGVFYSINWLAGNQPLFEELRANYLECDLLPSITDSGNFKAIPRLYIYSANDQVTLARNVERHAEQAGSLGLNTSVERFEKSPHVAHARTDPDRYWSAIDKTWQAARDV